jgi:hypothetical protein
MRSQSVVDFIFSVVPANDDEDGHVIDMGGPVR